MGLYRIMVMYGCIGLGPRLDRVDKLIQGSRGLYGVIWGFIGLYGIIQCHLVRLT